MHKPRRPWPGSPEPPAAYTLYICLFVQEPTSNGGRRAPRQQWHLTAKWPHRTKAIKMPITNHLKTRLDEKTSSNRWTIYRTTSTGNGAACFSAGQPGDLFPHPLWKAISFSEKALNRQCSFDAPNLLVPTDRQQYSNISLRRSLRYLDF